MKFFIRLLFIFGFAKGFAQSWQPLPMYGGGFITHVVVHPTTPSVIVGVCDVGGLFISNDDCQTWTSHTANVPKTDFRNFYIRSFAFDPTTPTTQYYLSGDAPYNSTGKIFKTVNNGSSWTATNLPVNVSGNSTGYAGESILVNPLTTNVLYVGGQPTYNYATSSFNTDGGLITSTDGGATWTKIGGTAFDKAWITKLRFANGDPSVIYVSAIQNSVNGTPTTGTGLWRYNVATATLTQLTTTDVLDFDMDAVSNGTIITTSSTGNRVSTDAGATWASLNTPSGLTYGLFATAHPTQGGVWYFGTFMFGQNSIVTTTNSGTTWTQVKYSSTHNALKINYPSYLNTNLKPSFGNYMACLVIRSGKAYLSDWYGVWRTADAATDLANPSAAATVNSNWSWQFLSQGIHNMVQVRTSLHPTDANRFYANVADLHYYESTDAGVTMQYTPVAPMNMTCRIDFHKNNPSVGFMVGTQEHGDIGKIYKTTNGGTSWSEIAAATFNGGSRNITDLQVTPSVNTLIVGIERNTLPSQVYRSDDGGTTWTAWDAGLTASNVFKTWDKFDRLLKDADGETFYIWRDNKLFRRKLTDAAWVQVPLPISANWLSDAKTHRTTAGTLYIAQYTSNIYKSTNWGATWTPISTPADVGSFALSPSGNNVVFQSWDGGDAQILYQSQNGGTAWTPLSTTGFFGMMSAFTFLNETKIIGWSVGNSGFSRELATPLPLDLLSFSGFLLENDRKTGASSENTEGGKNVLTWQTANEINVSHFTVERSFDGKTFEAIGNVKAKNRDADYEFTDDKTSARFENSPTLGSVKIVYYRLKINELDNRFSYSKTISLARVDTYGRMYYGRMYLRVYPSVSNGILNIETPLADDFTVVNVLGQQVMQGKTTPQIDISHLTSGAYILTIGTAQARFLKE